jgi:hypothetical protein
MHADPELTHEPNFLYINTDYDCIAIGIGGNADRDVLLGMATKRDSIYAWLVKHTEGTDDADMLPDQSEITSIDVEMSDFEEDALSGGNETTEVWKPR